MPYVPANVDKNHCVLYLGRQLLFYMLCYVALGHHSFPHTWAVGWCMLSLFWTCHSHRSQSKAAMRPIPPSPLALK